MVVNRLSWNTKRKRKPTGEQTYIKSSIKYNQRQIDQEKNDRTGGALWNYFKLLTHETNSSYNYVPALIFLPALHQVHMFHNMLSGMDLLTRLRGTLLPEKEAKSSSQFSCKGEDTIIFCWYSFSDTYRMTNPLTSFFVKNLVYSFWMYLQYGFKY